MVIRFLLLVFAGIAGWWVASQCLSRQIISSVHLVTPRDTASQTQVQVQSSKSGIIPKWHEIDPQVYSYDDYLRDIPEKMVKSEREYQLRKQIFDDNMEAIQAFHQEPQQSGRLGLNLFMDLFPEELPQRGYDKSQNAIWNGNAIDSSIVSLSDVTSASVRAREVRKWIFFVFIALVYIRSISHLSLLV